MSNQLNFPENLFIEKPLLHEKARHLALQVQLKILPPFEK
jgi:hypothetical protein